MTGTNRRIDTERRHVLVESSLSTYRLDCVVMQIYSHRAYSHRSDLAVIVTAGYTTYIQSLRRHGVRRGRSTKESGCTSSPRKVVICKEALRQRFHPGSYPDVVKPLLFWSSYL